MSECDHEFKLKECKDGVHTYQCLQCGDVIIEMIQKNWTYGKIKQVIGEDPTSEFDNKVFFKYK